MAAMVGWSKTSVAGSFRSSAEALAQHVAQLDGHQRVEAEVEQRLVARQARRVGDAQHAGDGAADDVDEDVVALVGQGAGEHRPDVVDERRRPRAAAADAPRAELVLGRRGGADSLPGGAGDEHVVRGAARSAASSSGKAAPRRSRPPPAPAAHALGVEQRHVGAPAVVEALPPLDQAGRHVEPARVGGALVGDEHATRGEQRPDVGERDVEVARWRGARWRRRRRRTRPARSPARPGGCSMSRSA